MTVSPKVVKRKSVNRLVAAGRLTHVYGQYVQYKDRAYDEPNGPFHNRITPFRKGVANRHYTTAPRPIEGAVLLYPVAP